MQKLLMPRLAPTMTSGIISKWIKKEGDPVMKGEPLMIVETEKVSVEVESPASGRLAKVIRPEGLESQVGDLHLYWKKGNNYLQNFPNQCGLVQSSILHR